MLFVGIFLFSGNFPIETLALAPMTAVAQAIASAGMFALFFRLQAVGGPVYLSQIGYVGAAIGLLSGLLFLGESYGWLTWAGAAVITIGIVLTTKAQRSQ